MEIKEIKGIKYLVYETGMLMNDPKKSYYIKNDINYVGDLKCLHFYALKNVRITGNQYVQGKQSVIGDQIVKGDQNVEGYQYVRGNQVVEGNQYVEGYQVVKGDQNVEGNQYVRGNQYVEGNQTVIGDQVVQGTQLVQGDQSVRFITIHLYCKWAIVLDRDSDTIQIGCEAKTITQWDEFFKTKSRILTNPESKGYRLLESAFNIAKGFIGHLTIMNENQIKINQEKINQ